jgi:hypothetical protein
MASEPIYPVKSVLLVLNGIGRFSKPLACAGSLLLPELWRS